LAEIIAVYVRAYTYRNKHNEVANCVAQEPFSLLAKRYMKSTDTVPTFSVYLKCSKCLLSTQTCWLTPRPPLHILHQKTACFSHMYGISVVKLRGSSDFCGMLYNILTKGIILTNKVSMSWKTKINQQNATN